MKNIKIWWNEGIVSEGKVAGDGRSVTGASGRLHIALTREGLRRLAGQPAPAAWLLPLNDPELVQQAAGLPGEIRWLCPCPPVQMAGRLLDGFRGGWWEGRMAWLCLEDRPEVYEWTGCGSGGDSVAVLAFIAARRWSGCSPARVQRELDAAARETFPAVIPIRMSFPQAALA